MSEHGDRGSKVEGDSAADYEEGFWDPEQDGVPRLADVRPASRGFLYFIVAAIPCFLVGLWAITDPLGPRPARFFPDAVGSWAGILLIMLAAGLLMTAAVYHSASAHEDGH